MVNHKITLKKFTELDFDRLIAWVKKEEELIQFAGTIFKFPLTKGQLYHYLTDTKRHAFKVVDDETNQIIGHCEAYEVDDQKCRLCRILIGDEDFRGKGYGTVLVRQLTHWSFETLNVKSIELNVYDFNIPAIKCYEKIGFKKAEINTGQTRIKNESWTSYSMTICRDSFTNKTELQRS